MTSDTDISLLRLIAAENYAEFDRRLPEYIRSVNARDPEAAQQLGDFLRAALLAARMKRAHYQHELGELPGARLFLGPRTKPHTIDFVG
jgi:hypothetical protein